MKKDELKKSANTLPLAPGVYIMRDKANKVIYVGKAKILKNRVSQYFLDSASHSPKTRAMVEKVDHFDVIVASSEFEALVLECSLIKQHLPKYNILLKDGKGYPYIRLNLKDNYPSFKIVTHIENDGAEYFGPFGSRGITNNILQTLYKVFSLPNCGKKFPRDIGKDRPCLNYQMGLCEGWCQANKTQHEYSNVIKHAKQLLLGDYKTVANSIKQQMLAAANELNFELASALRDKYNAVLSLGKKQNVTAITVSDIDVIGYAQTETKACFAVLHFSDGNLIDKEYEVLPATDDYETAVASLVKQYYLTRGFVPKIVLLPSRMEDSHLLAMLLKERFHKSTSFRTPQRGDNLRLIEIAFKNAKEEAERATNRIERYHATLKALGNMLGIGLPKRIESFDISNISNTDIVACMVVFENGIPKKSEYKKFKIREIDTQDDYASMQQAVKRRFQHYIDQDEGFQNLPDLLLIDGGVNHAKAATCVLEDLGISLNTFGMVKDDRHRTRALVSPCGNEIHIDNQQSVFSLIGSIQEETHRFAIDYHKKLRSKRLRYSELDKIPGIGKSRKELLLKVFKSIHAISNAELFELEQQLPKNVALTVYNYFKKKREAGDS